MPKKILVICNTFYQMLMAMQMHDTIFKAEFMDVIITDQSPVDEDMVSRIRRLNCFQNVYYLPSVKRPAAKGYMGEKINSLKEVFKIVKGSCPLEIQSAKYDLFMYYNLDMTVLTLFAGVYDKDMECARYEEGILSYNNLLY